MTDHRTLPMRRTAQEVTDKAIIMAILDLTSVCNVAFHDEPYPYVVPMNYGYEWNDQLTFYMHMGRSGHRLELLNQDPRVSLTVYDFLDRIGYLPYRNENHDYRSVMVYGHADYISPLTHPDEFLHAIQTLCNHTNRFGINSLTKPMLEELYMLRVTADIVRCKAQYPLSSPEEAPIPPLVERKPAH